jgi:TonB family protein
MDLKKPVLSIGACVLMALTASSATPGKYTPPRYQGGSAPPNQIAAVGGGEVFLQVELSPTGAMTNLVPLRSTPPFTQPVLDAVHQWRFKAAIQEMVPEAGEVPQTVAQNLVKSKVFVAAMFRPPTLAGPTIGVAPSDVASPASDMASPTSTALPDYPVNMRIDGTVIVEIHVGSNGATLDTTVVQSTPGFDGSALNAVANWSFRPARVNGALTDSYAYVCFGFRAPVGPPTKSGIEALLIARDR